MSRAPSVTDGVPREIDDDRPVGPLPRVIRLARASRPPRLAALVIARDVLGELQTRRLATPLAIIDDRWEDS